LLDEDAVAINVMVYMLNVYCQI